MSRIAGEVNEIVTPVVIAGKNFLRNFSRLGNRALFHGLAGALTKEFHGWLECGSDDLGKLFEEGDSLMNHKGETDVLDIQYCSNHVVPLELTNIQKYLPPVHTISKAQDATPIETNISKTQQATHQ